MTLDLTLLATGFQQHVFVRTDGSDGWVYKVPAAFGYLLPYEHRVGTKGPVTSVRKALHRVVVAWPHEFRTGVLEPLATRLERGVPVLAPVVLGPLRAADRVVRHARDRFLMAYRRRRRAAAFDAMLSLLDELERAGLAPRLLPYRIERSVTAVLRVAERSSAYQGPMLMQRATTEFFTRQRLATFRWADLVETVHALWRHGFALTEVGENLGYRSWAMLDGRVYLADTGSLTRRLVAARRALRDVNLDAYTRRLLDFHGDSATGREFAEYLGFIRREINLARFDALWRTADSATEPHPLAPPAGALR